MLYILRCAERIVRVGIETIINADHTDRMKLLMNVRRNTSEFI